MQKINDADAPAAPTCCRDAIPCRRARRSAKAMSTRSNKRVGEVRGDADRRARGGVERGVEGDRGAHAPTASAAMTPSTQQAAGTRVRGPAGAEARRRRAPATAGTRCRRRRHRHHLGPSTGRWCSRPRPTTRRAAARRSAPGELAPGAEPRRGQAEQRAAGRPARRRGRRARRGARVEPGGATHVHLVGRRARRREDDDHEDTSGRERSIRPPSARAAERGRP